MTPGWLGQMERILETLNQGVVLIDDQDAMIFGNRVFEQMLGLDAGEWKQKSPRELYDNAALQFLEEKRQSSRDADQFEFFLPRPNSAPMPVVVTTRRTTAPDGMPYHVITLTDITEQKTHEQELREANRLLAESQQLLQMELTLAARVQRTLVPQPMVWETFVVETAYEPAHTIGGDFGLVAPRDHHLNLLVCDVSGHGISAALIANRIYMETVALVGQERLDQLLHKLNRMVLDGIQPEGFFFTMAVARIDRNRRLTYAGAGHPPAILVTPAGEVRMLASRSGALGLMDDPMDADPTEEVEMSAGDRLLLMTDGLTEVFNNRREMLGDEGLNRIVKSHVRAPLAEMKQAILDDVAAWRQGPATDDVSMVLVEVG